MTRAQDVDQGDTPKFVIAALGASAGGLEPLEAFFKNMPADAGIAFVIIQHLAPDHPTALPQLLGRQTKMPVEQAQDNMKVVPNRVYIIPPNAALKIEKSTLRVTPPTEARGARTPIDGFFSSLAEDCGEHAVCIMLSGTGTDGTLGLRAVKEYGGMAMAQTLDSAQYDSILRSAIATGLVDHVLPVEEMPAQLLEYAAHLISLANGNGTLDSVSAQLASQMGKVHAILRRTVGHDFSRYKEATITRRLARRMKALQIETVVQYVQTLDRQPEEVNRLFNDLLIGVTHFFRDHEAFAALQAEVIPKLFQGKGADDHLRVCVMGCSTGEEAYSIAILLLEHASTLNETPRIQVFATDIDESSLAMARKGRYPESIAEHVTAERLQRFFHSQDGGWQVDQELRDIIVFSSHSFIKDPPFSRLELITCRNVLIYLEPELQKKLLPLFHYALRPGGYLFLGPSESAASHKELFGTLDKKHRIFERKETLSRPGVIFPVTEFSRLKLPGVPSGRKPSEVAGEQDLAKRLERIILQRYRPACVAVKENGDAVYFSGRLDDYFEHPAGIPSVNVINMAREGLRIPLRTVLHKAATAGERVSQKQISVQRNGGFRQVDLTVEPITEFNTAKLYMVVFEDAVSSSTPQQVAPPADDAGLEKTFRHLEDELRSAQENAQTMFEELESSNEELQSSNEEFQSTNEELETSKEELQSYNEELRTVNTEISRKSGELDLANSDLKNLLDSTQIATIFLDPELRIKSFTPAAGSVFSLIGGDVGRPITDLAAWFADVNLVPDIAETLRTLQGRERQLSAMGGQHYLLRVLPYRSVKNVIDGVVLTLTDITQAKHAEEARLWLAAIVESATDAIISTDPDGIIRSWNKGAEQIFGYAQEEVIGKSVFLLALPGGGDEFRDILKRVSRGERIEPMEAARLTKNGRTITISLTISPILDSSGRVVGAARIARDISARKRAEDARRRQAAQFETLIKEAPLGIYVIDADFRLQQVNPTALPVFGNIPGLIGRDLDEVMHILLPKAFADEVVRLFRHTLETGEPYTTPERVEVRLDRGVTEYYAWHINRIQLMDDRDGVVCYFWDISAQVRARAALVEREEELLRVNTDLKHFAYAASHHLQDPLRRVTSYTQVLAKQHKGRLDPLAEQAIAYAGESAKQMELLLKGSREFWEVNEVKAQQEVYTDCNRILQEVLALFGSSIQQSAAVITHDPLPTVRAEEIPLTLLFKNLVSNALNYTRPGEPPRIHISAQESAGAWTFSVRDHGIGIEAEYLETIFAPFKRLHSAEEYPGTGLGLAICHKIVERNRGRIWAESTYGQGSTFYFAIPVEGDRR